VAERPRIVVTDSSVLINFIHASRLDILGSLAPWTFVFPDHVEKEITRPDQIRTLLVAVRKGFLRLERTTEMRELDRFSELIRAGLGRGEAACLAMALERGWTVASDERGRFLRIAYQQLGEKRLVNTPGLLLLAIRRRVISIDEADRIKAELERKRFRMKFRSFRDLRERRRS
jgi:predicted nucleic acid-binding protein